MYFKKGPRLHSWAATLDGTHWVLLDLKSRRMQESKSCGIFPSQKVRRAGEAQSVAGKSAWRV